MDAGKKLFVLLIVFIPPKVLIIKLKNSLTIPEYYIPFLIDQIQEGRILSQNDLPDEILEK